MLEENMQFAFLKKHLSKIVVLLVVATFAFFFLEKKWEGKKVTAKNDVIRATKLISEVQMGHSFPQESIDEMKSIVKKHPYLAPKYEPCLGLVLLSQRQEEESIAHIAAALKRHEQEKGSLYSFNELTLLIEQKAYSQALALSRNLEITLEGEEYPMLHCYNLLRTLFLAREANDVLLANVTWDKLQRHPSWPQLAPLFQEGDLTLHDYLHHD